MKKTVLFLMSVALLIALSVSAMAIEANPGDTVEIPLTLNNTNACYVKVTAYYDASVFEFVSYTAVNGQAGSSIVLADTKVLPSGQIGTVTLRVKTGAVPGTYSIGANVEECWDIDENQGIVSAFGGTVTVNGEEPPQGCTHQKTAEKVTKEATCEAAGEKQIVCVDCGEVIKTEIIPALGHKWDSGMVTAEPTCEKKGVKTYTCQNDNAHTKTEEIPALGHKWDGGKVTTEPTCEKKGVKTYTCQNNNTHTKTEEIPALGHKWDNGKVTTEATCEKKGVKTYTCQNDNTHTKTEEIPALGHDAKWITIKEATRTEDGLRQKICSRCSAVLEEEAIPMVVENWQYNSVICCEGIPLRDVNPALTPNWYMFTPVDLSQDGVQEVNLVIGNSRYAGTVTVTVKNGKAVFDVRLNPFVQKRDITFTVLTSLDLLLDAEMKRQDTFAFGQEISIEEELNGSTNVLLYVFGHGDYDAMENLMDWFLPDSASYQQTVKHLKNMME